ncbi:MAG TPA: biopolymer transporter ExbD [Candidatus Limnocylindria bacterium]|nr:biopolymer transporter ExbD [Candidatus Limnocylindria bacterium]
MAIRFQRTTRLIRGQFDLAPFMCVTFALLFFMLFGGYLVLPKGTILTLPSGGSPLKPWALGGYFVIAIDAHDRIYFENQIVEPAVLRQRLAARVASVGSVPGRVYLQADRGVRLEKLVEIEELAKSIGVKEVVLGAIGPAK